MILFCYLFSVGKHDAPQPLLNQTKTACMQSTGSGGKLTVKSRNTRYFYITSVHFLMNTFDFHCITFQRLYLSFLHKIFDLE